QRDTAPRARPECCLEVARVGESATCPLELTEGTLHAPPCELLPFVRNDLVEDSHRIWRSARPLPRNVPAGRPFSARSRREGRVPGWPGSRSAPSARARTRAACGAEAGRGRCGPRR